MTERAAKHLDNNWEAKLDEITPAWMNMNKMIQEELEARLAKHAAEMAKGNYINIAEAFKKLNKELGIS